MPWSAAARKKRAELESLSYPAAFAYFAAAAGMAAALLSRSHASRRGRSLSLAEAAWPAFLPPLALVLLPAAALLRLDESLPLGQFHLNWHRWEEAIHASPQAHGLLHAANNLLLLAGAACMLRALYLLARMRAFSSSLRAAAVPVETPQGRIYLLASPRPLCFAAGVIDPVIYLTTALRDRISERDLQVVLAHERAHLRRRDGLLHSFLHFFYTLFPLPGARRLMSDWQGAVERRCDAAAAAELGSRCDVAAALVRAAAVMSPPPAQLPALASFSAEENAVEERVRALLTRAEPRGGAAPAAAGLALLMLSGFWLHHLVALLTRH